jgi:translocation and assembly module TamA
MALLLGCPALLWAQTLPDGAVAPAPQNPASAAAALPSGPAFTLAISAPDDIKPLLERHLELQRYRELGDLTDDELDRLLDLARADTQNLVATLGYFSPIIQITRQNPGDSQAGRSVNISIIAGEPVQVSQVLVRFSGAIADDPAAVAQRQLIQDSWSLPPGNRFTQARWDAAKQQALRQLTTQRYPTGTLGRTLADVDPLTHQARLEITLDSGQPYQLGSLEITGLQRFDSQLVHRLARIPMGADYDQKQLVDAQQRLTGSGFFDSAFVSIDTSTDPHAARVLVTLREARLQKITLGAGFSTDGGARLSAEHLHNLVPGLGWRASSKLSVDRETQSLGTALTAPPDDSGWRWNTSLLLLNQKSGSFEVTSQRLRGGASQDGERIDRSYYLQYDRADSATTDQTASTVAESISANYTFTLHNFDAMPFPSSGWAWGVELGGGSTLGSTQEPYGRILTRWQSFWPLGSNGAATPDLRAGRLVVRAQLGAVLAHEGISLPATQLFLAGGDNSVRGYGLHQIGTDLIGDKVSAGRYMAVGSLEWQRPITVKGMLTDWEGTLFIDAGAVADKPADLQAKVGVGTGVRWKSPVGPLQIDLAYGVAVQQFRLHLNVGFVF